MKKLTYGIIGDGKMAKNFIKYLEFLNIDYLQWSRKNNSVEELQTIATSCDPILLLITDSAIELFFQNLIKKYPGIQNKKVIHFSGSLVLNGAYGIHPLMTFTDKLCDKETYLNIPFVQDDNLKMCDLLPEIPNKLYNIKKEQKALYHCLCVMGNNFSRILWRKVIEDFSVKLNLPAEILYPYISKTFADILQKDKVALSGPLVRKDQETIKRNLDSLNSFHDKQIYQAFVDYCNNQENK